MTSLTSTYPHVSNKINVVRSLTSRLTLGLGNLRCCVILHLRLLVVPPTIHRHHADNRGNQQKDSSHDPSHHSIHPRSPPFNGQREARF